MGTRIGKQKDNKSIASYTTSHLQSLVLRGGKEKQKALTELSKRGQPAS